MSGTVGGSSVNPNAPLSVPTLLQQLMSLQALVEHWLHQLRELEMAGEDALVMNLRAKSLKKGARPQLFPGKYRDKPVRCIRPKCSPRRIIHQPR